MQTMKPARNKKLHDAEHRGYDVVQADEQRSQNAQLSTATNTETCDSWYKSRIVQQECMASSVPAYWRCGAGGCPSR